MNKLDELIQLFCPAGVEFVKIGEVVDMNNHRNTLLTVPIIAMILTYLY